MKALLSRCGFVWRFCGPQALPSAPFYRLSASGCWCLVNSRWHPVVLLNAFLMNDAVALQCPGGGDTALHGELRQQTADPQDGRALLTQSKVRADKDAALSTLV